MPKSNTRRKGRHGKRQEQASSLVSARVQSKLWNVTSQPWPSFNNTLKRDNSVHHFIQTTDLGTVITSSTVGAVFYARAFTFTDITQSSTLGSLFDQYRISEIETWLIPGNVASSQGFGSGSYVYTATDYDDDTAWSTLAQAQQYTNLMQGGYNNGHYRKWKPHVAEALFAGTFTGYGNIKAPWIDVASSSVKHYGFKAAVSTAANSNVVQTYSLTVRIHFECRNVF